MGGPPHLSDPPVKLQFLRNRVNYDLHCHPSKTERDARKGENSEVSNYREIEYVLLLGFNPE